VDLLKKLATLFAVSAPSSQWYSLSVQCNRCSEIIHTQINLSNDLSVEYDERENVTGYFCRKVLMGKQRCFQPINVTLTFDAKRKVIDRKIEGGKFVE
jgi:hypothetical protein